MGLVGKLYRIKLYNPCTIFSSFPNKYQPDRAARGDKVCWERLDRAAWGDSICCGIIGSVGKDDTFQTTSSHVSREHVKEWSRCVVRWNLNKRSWKTHILNNLVFRYSNPWTKIAWVRLLLRSILQQKHIATFLV